MYESVCIKYAFTLKKRTEFSIQKKQIKSIHKLEASHTRNAL